MPELHGITAFKAAGGVKVTNASSSVQHRSASAPPLNRLIRYSPGLVPALFRESLSVQLRRNLAAFFCLSQAAPREKVPTNTWSSVPDSWPTPFRSEFLRIASRILTGEEAIL